MEFRSPSPPGEGTDMFSGKNAVIAVLIFLLVLSFLGINLLAIFGNWIQVIIQIFGPAISQILSVFGYTAGTLIDKSADVVTDVGKSGIDIAGGAVHSVGGLLKDASRPNMNDQSAKQLDQAISSPGSIKIRSPSADIAANPIQNPISAGKSGWCLVGEYQTRRGCIEVTDQDKCLSGQVFPSQKLCLNPTLTNNMPLNALKSVPE